jgi:hypothetical protein
MNNIYKIRIIRIKKIAVSRKRKRETGGGGRETVRDERNARVKVMI